MLLSQGKYAEAEAGWRAAAAMQERILGPENPETLASRANLCAALRAQGKEAEAEMENRAVLAVYERVLSPGHPKIASSCYNLALCLKAQTNNSGALEYESCFTAGKLTASRHCATSSIFSRWYTWWISSDAWFTNRIATSRGTPARRSRYRGVSVRVRSTAELDEALSHEAKQVGAVL